MRTLLIDGDKTFRITIPENATVTFAPWSPPKKDTTYRSEGDRAGTLRIYSGGSAKGDIIGCWSGVRSFRDTSINYSELVVRQEGATVWKDDEKGYVTEHKQSTNKAWVNPERELPPVVKRGRPRKVKEPEKKSD